MDELGHGQGASEGVLLFAGRHAVVGLDAVTLNELWRAKVTPLPVPDLSTNPAVLAGPWAIHLDAPSHVVVRAVASGAEVARVQVDPR